MIKELTKSVPEKIKTGVKGAKSTLSNLEKELKVGYQKVSAQAQSFSADDLKKRVTDSADDLKKRVTDSADDLKKRVTDFRKKAAGAVGKAVGENLEKAYGALNIPTRSEVDQIARKINKVNQDVRKMIEARAKPVKTAKKPVKKTAAKKKTAKKTAKK